MRLTGQATTSIGNFCVNLMTHREFISLNQSKVRFMAGLGDDFAAGMTDYPEIGNTITNI